MTSPTDFPPAPHVDLPTPADELLQQIATLNQAVWEHRVGHAEVKAWLQNFGEDQCDHLHALFLLSQFLYFGDQEVRALLRTLFQEYVRAPFMERKRRALSHTREQSLLDAAFALALGRTRFLGIGNASESGPHLLYYFRQENELKKELFRNAWELLDGIGTATPTLREPDVELFVFLDDFCGTGDSALKFYKEVVQHIVAAADRDSRSIRTAYFSLVAFSEGLESVRAGARFDEVAAVITLDESFKCFGDRSRYFEDPLPNGVSKDYAHSLCLYHGTRLNGRQAPFGFGDCQLLIGFHHNTPDNTLPIFWGGNEHLAWRPIFRRFHKSG